MAISPRSKGLGNIGSIVNRQRLAAPTRPAPKPAPKPVAKMPVPKPVAAKANPFAGGKTTTLAQRQAMSPFNSSAKPVNKFDPLARQMPQPQVSPGPMIPPQPFNPQPTPQPIIDPFPSIEIDERDRSPAYNGPGPNDPMMPAPQPFNPFNPPGGYTPGLPYYIGSGPDFGGPVPEPMPGFGGVVQGSEWFGTNPDGSSYTGNNYQPVNTPGGGIFGGNLPNMIGNAVGQGLGGMFGNFGSMVGNAANTAMQSAFNPTVDNGGMPMANNQISPAFNAGGATMARFADFNPTVPTDYDQLEGSGFNTNSSGSLFGGGGFANQ